MVRVTTGWTPEGQQTREIIGYYATKQEANIALANYHQKPLSPKANMTLHQVYDEWSESRFRRISKSTIDGYKASWKYLSIYKDATFRNLRTSQWQKIIDDNDNMSMSTITKIKALGTSLYDFATANDIVDKNYMEFVELPEKESKEKEPFNDLEIQKLWNNVGQVPWVDTILILIYTGMRISEMCLLTKFDIDMEHRLITGGIKTDAGKDRIIPIHPDIFPLIEKRYKTKYSHLVTYPNGQPITSNHYRREKYYPALEAVGTRRLTPHSCRHTFGTILAREGMDTLSIQKIIGHSDYAFTANKYTHPDVQKLIEDMNKISFKSPELPRSVGNSQQTANKNAGKS
jgi:integrase